MTLISNCDAVTGWSEGALNDSFQLEGTDCLGLKVSNNLSPVLTYTFGVAVDMTDKFITMTMLITGKARTKAEGGYRVYAEDSLGNNGTWYVGGSDTLGGGWGFFSVDPSTTPTSGTGTIDVTDILIVGIQMYTASIALGNSANIFWDICHYGSYIGATSLVTDTVTMQDLSDYSEANFYGNIQKINGVYFCKGKVLLGADTINHINFEDSGSTIVWVYEQFIPIAGAGIEVLGDSATTSNVVFKNGLVKGYLTAPSIDADDPNIDVFEMSTMLIQNIENIYTATAASVLNCIIDGSEGINLTDGTYTGCTFSGTRASPRTPLGSVNISDSASANLVTDASFSTYANSDAPTASTLAVYVPASVTTFTMDNWQFDDPNNTVAHALYWAGLSPNTLTISSTNGTNLTESGCFVEEPGITEGTYDPFGDSSTIAQWNFDDNLTDEGGSYDITGVGGYAYADGDIGRVVTLDGADATKLNASGLNTLGYADVLAVSFKVKLASLKSHQIMDIATGSSASYPWFRAYMYNNEIVFGFMNSGGSMATYISGSFALTTDVEHSIVLHLSGVINSLTGFKLFVDGIEDLNVTSINLASNLTATTSTTGVHIGCRNVTLSGYNLYGYLDVFRIHDRWLTSDEIDILNNEGTTVQGGTITVEASVSITVPSVPTL